MFFQFFRPWTVINRRNKIWLSIISIIIIFKILTSLYLNSLFDAGSEHSLCEVQLFILAKILGEDTPLRTVHLELKNNVGTADFFKRFLTLSAKEIMYIFFSKCSEHISPIIHIVLSYLYEFIIRIIKCLIVL